MACCPVGNFCRGVVDYGGVGNGNGGSGSEGGTSNTGVQGGGGGGGGGGGAETNVPPGFPGISGNDGGTVTITNAGVGKTEAVLNWVEAGWIVIFALAGA